MIKHALYICIGEEQILRAEEIFEHEKYDIVTQENDISLIRTKTNIKFNPTTAAPVCLPNPGQKFTGVYIL